MPLPVSVTIRATKSPHSPSGVSSGLILTFLAVIVIVPPSGIASRALTTRLISASSSSWTSQPSLQYLRVAADNHQHIVEIVCNAAGKLAQRLHLLRLGEL